MKENLLTLKKEAPSARPNDSMAVLAKKWRSLDDDSKASFAQRAKLAKQEFLHKMQEFEAGPLQEFLLTRKNHATSSRDDEDSSESSSESSSSSEDEDENDSEAEEILEWKKKNG